MNVRASGLTVDSHGLAVTYTPLNVSRAIATRRFSSGFGGVRVQIDNSGKMLPRALNTSVRLRRCDRYAFGRFGFSTTCRHRLSDGRPGQVSTTFPPLRSMALRV